MDARVTLNRNSPPLARALARGMSFNEWRHEHTDYDRVSRRVPASQYAAFAEAWAHELIAGLNELAHKQTVARWALKKDGISV